jgi:hypothetical protein
LHKHGHIKDSKEPFYHYFRYSLSRRKFSDFKNGKNAYYKSLAASLTFSFSALIMIALLVACSLQMYVNYNTQKELLIANQELIAKNTANTVTNTIREKYNLLSAASKHKDLTELQENEITLTLERLMGIEPAFRQITIFNMHKEEMTRVSRLSRSLSSRTMVYDHNDLFIMTGNREIYIGPVYIDEITRVPMMAIGVPLRIFLMITEEPAGRGKPEILWDLMYQIRIV